VPESQKPVTDVSGVAAHEDTCEALLQFLKWDHLQPHLQPIVQECYDTATLMLDSIPHNKVLEAGLWRLIEAKDYFCRARLAQ
jgi:hypothetical protein